MMTVDEARRIWKRLPTPEIEAEAERLVGEALDHGYELDLSDLLFLAFSAGLNAADKNA
jgi:hypothetical protein